MPIKKINIKQLEVGMYIIGLDISWIRSPFLKHSRLIEKSKDIQLLIQAGVKEVTIDTAKCVNQKTADINKNHINNPVDTQVKQQLENSVTSDPEPEQKKTIPAIKF